MMKRLIFLLFFVGFGEVLFGQQNCVADLSAQKGDLEKVIAQIDVEFEDKGKLKYLPNLFKSCVSNVELETIREIYLSLKFDAPEQQTYKTIIKRILDDHKLLCVDFVNNIRKGGTSKNYVAELDDLLKEYENLKQKNTRANTYEGTPTENNYNVLSQLKPLLSDCVTGENLKAVQDLNTQIVTENFGGLTINFVANLKEILSTNSKLFETLKIDDSYQKPQDPSEDKDINLVLLLAGVFIVPILLIWLFETKNEKVKQKAEPKKNLSPILSRHKVEYLEKENLKLRNTLQSFKETTKAIDNNINTEEQLKALKVKDNLIASQQRELERLKAEIKQLKQVKEPETPKIEKLLFFAEADWQGNFIAPNATKTPKLGASIYRFLLNEESDEAIFEFYNMPSTFLSVMNNPGVKLFNVCIADNDFNGNANKIETIKKGKAILKKGKWLVAEKALIRFSI
jgi:hypothetical protein